MKSLIGKELTFPDIMIPVLIDKYTAIGADPLPDAATLSELIKLAFFSSLEHEEGRSLRFVLAFLNEPHMNMKVADGWAPLPFTAPRPATVAEIIKLAPATDARQTMIAVTNRSGQLVISGLIRMNLDHYRMARNESRSGRKVFLWYPRIDVTGPATFSIGIHETDFFRYSSGVTLTHGVNVLLASGPVHDTLDAAVAPHFTSDPEEKAPVPFTPVLGYLLQRIVDRAHGGSVVILPSESCLSDVDVKYAGHGKDLSVQFQQYWHAWTKKQRIESGLLMMKKSKGQQPPYENKEESRLIGNVLAETANWYFQEKHMYDTVDSLACLTDVDGALVIGPDLTILGFGGMFKWGDSEPPTMLALDHKAGQRETFDIHQLGSRHRSAAHFCYRNPGSVAFVMSQDGPLTCMLRPANEETLLIWRPVDLSWYKSALPPFSRTELLHIIENAMKGRKNPG